MNKKEKLEKIAARIKRCPLCRNWGTGKAVPGEGSPDAQIVFIGEAPGKEEARTGRPFVGRSGKLLRETIRGIGLKEDEVFITSPVHYLPPRGAPSKESIAHGLTHLIKQLSVIEPEIIVLLGNTAGLALLDRAVNATREHGSVVRSNDRTYFITFHPAYALRFTGPRALFIRDFNSLGRLIKKLRAERKNAIVQPPSP